MSILQKKLELNRALIIIFPDKLGYLVYSLVFHHF